jgi:aryl-alcohol dehydrogenase-like predicted oxidoreductase
VVARALEGVAAKPYIFTKCGMVWNDQREITNSLKQIKTECEASLRRLKVDAIDLYQIHWPKPDAEVEEGWTVMAELRQEGKVRHIGVSNFSVEQMERALRIAPVTSLQPPYSMINRSAEPEILPFCAAKGIGVIHYSPMQSGLLTGSMTAARVAAMPEDDFRKRAKNFQEPLLSKNLELAALLGAIGERHGVSAGVVAIAWTLHHPAVTAAIVGGRNAKQVEGVFPSASFVLSEEEFAEIGRALAARA